MQLSSDLLEFIQLLNQKKAEYLIIGGWAVSIYAKPRYTKDIDILIGRTEENAKKIFSVLTEFGFGSVGILENDLLIEGYVIQLGFEPNRIDLLTQVVGVDFYQAWGRKNTVTFQGVEMNLIGINDLIINKTLAGRDQDLVDVKELKKTIKQT